MAKPSLAANVSLSLSLFLVLPPSILLYSISPNPRCWYRETRWSASNQRQDPSSSFASSYSWRARVEGVVLSIHFSPSLVSFVLHPPVSLELPLPPPPVGDSTTSISDSGFTCGNPLTLRLKLVLVVPFLYPCFSSEFICDYSLLWGIFRNYHLLSFINWSLFSKRNLEMSFQFKK